MNLESRDAAAIDGERTEVTGAKLTRTQRRGGARASLELKVFSTRPAGWAALWIARGYYGGLVTATRLFARFDGLGFHRFTVPS